MYKDNDFLYESIYQLENLIKRNIEVNSTRPEYDAVLSFFEEQFVVCLKADIRNSNFGMILGAVNELRSNTSKPVVVVAKYISKSIMNEFRERNINYIDVSGNAFISYRSIFVFIDGQKRKTTEKKNQSRAFQETGIKIIFYLLNNQDFLMKSYREIAEETGVSIGSVSNVMKELEELNFIVKTQTKRVLKNKKELLEKWMFSYNDVLRPRIFRKRMKFIGNESNGFRINNNNREVCLSGETAASILTNNLRPEKHIIYTQLPLSELSKEYKMIPDEHGNIDVYQKFWNINSFNSSQLAPKLLVYTDLMNSGFGRNIEIAQMIGLDGI
ncbi:type IV toxin-antitoxin system AbiEi family antitoxin [Ochrovirga pacifica]|uniref:type IV toxin-antitoxin system AbiEi family antitoxin n=1 Tax=Ochrovirga pacifica TaxID=1042376 RepID=UPI0002557FFC|nr:type IV toxin-antitoxin system AbiEi family antitoxin [Ochrovirga pacifica]